uniref:PhzF family phenazine biosynthesis protein n=1 Tax=Chenopodium quinoa TaxID=63459 RepID=A0A803MC64_CHEQI
VDAFTSSPLKGNPAVVLLLDEEKDQECLQAMAQEFNLLTCYVTKVTTLKASKTPRYNLRWFAPASEVELMSSKDVTDYKPNMDEIRKWPGRGVAITGLAPPESEFDFFTRLFSPNFGIDEASPRGGILRLNVDTDIQSVLIAGEAVTVMEDSFVA